MAVLSDKAIALGEMGRGYQLAQGKNNLILQKKIIRLAFFGSIAACPERSRRVAMKKRTKQYYKDQATT